MTHPTQRRRIAVIGSGISGLACAHVLGPHHDVVLFEADHRLGGHSNTVAVDDPHAGRLAVDTGFIVHNDRNYPNLVRLFGELGVATVDTDMSFGVTDRDADSPTSGFTYRASSINTLFADRRNVANPAMWRMLSDIGRFYRRAKQLLAEPEPSVSLDEFLDANRFSRDFIELHLRPMGAAVWSADPSKFGEFPAVSLFTFLDNHGLLGVRHRPQWRTIPGGSRTYVDAIAARFRRPNPAGLARSQRGALRRRHSAGVHGKRRRSLRRGRDGSAQRSSVEHAGAADGCRTVDPRRDPLPTESSDPPHRHDDALAGAQGEGGVELRPTRRGAEGGDSDVRHDGVATPAGITSLPRQLEQRRLHRPGLHAGNVRLRPPGLRSGSHRGSAPFRHHRRGWRRALLRSVVGPRLPRRRHHIGPACLRATGSSMDGGVRVKPGGPAVCDGHVFHRRLTPKVHEFAYPVSYVWLDPDAPRDLCRHHPLWSASHVAPVHFRSRDYGDRSSVSLGDQVRNTLRPVVGRQQEERPDLQIRMLTQVRRWGWLFNPITLYVAWDAAGEAPVGGGSRGHQHTVERTASVRRGARCHWVRRRHHAVRCAGAKGAARLAVSGRGVRLRHRSVVRRGRHGAGHHDRCRPTGNRRGGVDHTNGVGTRTRESALVGDRPSAQGCADSSSLGRNPQPGSASVADASAIRRPSEKEKGAIVASTTLIDRHVTVHPEALLSRVEHNWISSLRPGGQAMTGKVGRRVVHALLRRMTCDQMIVCDDLPDLGMVGTAVYGSADGDLLGDITVHDVRGIRRPDHRRRDRARSRLHRGLVGQPRPDDRCARDHPQHRPDRRCPQSNPPPDRMGDRSNPRRVPIPRQVWQPRRHRCALRPRQRVLRALPRRDDDLLVGGVCFHGLHPRARRACTSTTCC